MAKDKKKPKSGKKAGSANAGAKLKALSDNPFVADVVAATLVAAAAALKDSNKARQLAASAGKELEEAAKQGAAKGNVLWQLALNVGRKSLEALNAEPAPKYKPKAKAKSKTALATKRKSAPARKKTKA